MKVNSISRITCHVEDLARAAEFYETIGFRRGKEEADRITFYVNWFFVTWSPRTRPRPNPGARGYSSTSRWMTSRTSTRPCSRRA
jgi:catechol 2,3-dioxygenase-like lactoylglutathione lyase family enzyme